MLYNKTNQPQLRLIMPQSQATMVLIIKVELSSTKRVQQSTIGNKMDDCVRTKLAENENTVRDKKSEEMNFIQGFWYSAMLRFRIIDLKSQLFA